MPIHRLNLPQASAGIITAALMMRQAGMSSSIPCRSMGCGRPCSRAHSGMMSVRSRMFAPMILPTESEACFLRMEMMVVTSSGSEVPMAIIVAAITASGTPMRRASSEPLSISSCAPSTMAAAPSTNLPMFHATVLPSFFGFSAGCSAQFL